jgi:hypothetical protein
MHCEGKLNLKSHNTSYCLIEVVTKAGLTVSPFVHYITGSIILRNLSSVLINNTEPTQLVVMSNLNWPITSGVSNVFP